MQLLKQVVCGDEQSERHVLPAAVLPGFVPLVVVDEPPLVVEPPLLHPASMRAVVRVRNGSGRFLSVITSYLSR